MARNYDEDFVAFAAAALPRLRRTAHLLCGDWRRADDAAHEALINLYGVWPKVNRREGGMAYARRTIIRVLVRQQRVRRRARYRLVTAAATVILIIAAAGTATAVLPGL